jgi:membrane protein
MQYDRGPPKPELAPILPLASTEGVMNIPLKDLIKKSFGEFSEDDGMTRAAAIAYYTVFSLPSLLLIVIYVAGVFFGRAAVSGQIQTQATSTFGSGVGGQLKAMIANANHTGGGTIATILGIAGLVFAATTTFTALQDALDHMWEVEPVNSGLKSLARKRILSFLMIIGIAILVLASLGATAVLSYLSGNAGLPFPGTVAYIVEIGTSWAIFAFLFGAIFKVLPDAEVSWKDVKVGGVITAALFVAGKFLIGLYLAHSSTASSFGAAGALALLLLWTYYSAIIFLFGAEFTQVWGREHGRSIAPEPGAVKVREEKIQSPEDRHQPTR